MPCQVVGLEIPDDDILRAADDLVVTLSQQVVTDGCSDSTEIAGLE